MIKKTSETTPVVASVVNQKNNSTTDAYSCDYANKAFGGKILWTNPNPTSNFDAQNVTLSSGDYDVYEIIFASGTGSTANLIRSSSGLVEKGKNGYGSIISVSGNYIRSRAFSYVDNTTIAFEVGYTTSITSPQAYSGGGHAVPIYVIGYKTGLF